MLDEGVCRGLIESVATAGEVHHGVRTSDEPFPVCAAERVCDGMDL
jgi:hypothetical protein